MTLIVLNATSQRSETLCDVHDRDIFVRILLVLLVCFKYSGPVKGTFVMMSALE